MRYDAPKLYQSGLFQIATPWAPEFRTLAYAICEVDILGQIIIAIARYAPDGLLDSAGNEWLSDLALRTNRYGNRIELLCEDADGSYALEHEASWDIPDQHADALQDEALENAQIAFRALLTAAADILQPSAASDADDEVRAQLAGLSALVEELGLELPFDGSRSN